jgi:predicted NUDIX family phosphoesterase
MTLFNTWYGRGFMSQAVQKTTPVFTGKHDERILVVKREHIFGAGGYDAWDGVKAVDMDQFLSMVESKKEFLWRSTMEEDHAYKQIIPYLIFENNGRYFLMQRHSKASDTRLRSKFSLGIGGHVRQDDIEGKDIFAWARREFDEEVNYSGSFEIETIGLINDDTNDVGKVHIGMVLLLRASSDKISVKSELQGGVMATVDECRAQYENMEAWSKLVFDHLCNR